MRDKNHRWVKSSHSGYQTNCVEVRNRSNGADVRDTKCRAAGHLSVPAAAWSAFLKTATQ